MLLSNRPHPMTWKLSQVVVPGINSTISPENFTVSRRSPCDMNFSSPRSSERYDNGGIGLGIVAALEKSSIGVNPVCYSESGSNESNPVRYSRRLQFAPDIDHSEEYTCVTSRDGRTKVYYNDHEFEFGQNRSGGDHRDRRWKESTTQIVKESPVKKSDVIRESPDFLASCCLCNKKLQGKDIYMYKGEKGYCSEECRSVKIMKDNLKVQHKSRSVEVLSSPYGGGEIVSTGIFVIY